MYEYKCKVIRVVDGDTFDGEVDLGFGVKKTERFRVAGLDTPETWRPKTEAEKAHGIKATQRAMQLLHHKTVVVRTHKKGKYGRYIAEVQFIDDRGNSGYTLFAKDYTTIMIEEGFQKKKENYYDIRDDLTKTDNAGVT